VEEIFLLGAFAICDLRHPRVTFERAVLGIRPRQRVIALIHKILILAIFRKMLLWELLLSKNHRYFNWCPPLGRHRFQWLLVQVVVGLGRN